MPVRKVTEICKRESGTDAQPIENCTQKFRVCIENDELEIASVHNRSCWSLDCKSAAIDYGMSRSEKLNCVRSNFYRCSDFCINTCSFAAQIVFSQFAGK